MWDAMIEALDCFVCMGLVACFAMCWALSVHVEREFFRANGWGRLLE